MNKFCHTGFSQIQELYNQHVEQIDSALQHCKETPCTNARFRNIRVRRCAGKTGQI